MSDVSTPASNALKDTPCLVVLILVLISFVVLTLVKPWDPVVGSGAIKSPLPRFHHLFLVRVIAPRPRKRAANMGHRDATLSHKVLRDSPSDLRPPTDDTTHVDIANLGKGLRLGCICPASAFGVGDTMR
jgi:hypothetical protein